MFIRSDGNYTPFHMTSQAHSRNFYNRHRKKLNCY